MIVLMFEPRFVAPILSGVKPHSIRGQRKRPIKGGDLLSLRQWEGKPYRSKQHEFARKKCLNVIPMCLDWHEINIAGYQPIVEPGELDEFARSDGFASWDQMRTYRAFKYGERFDGIFIQWGEHPLLRKV